MSRPKRKAVVDTAKRVKKARGETDLGWGLNWSSAGTMHKGMCPLLVLTSSELEGREKVASFDIDFTVIKTKSGRKFATGENDWEWWDKSVPGKLCSLDEDGYRLVFFTNQAGIEKDKVKPETVRNKVEAIIKELAVPVQVFICTGTNHYRKPSPLMWEYLNESCNQSVVVDKAKSFYVGDAAGRPKGWAKEKPKDFSCSDRMFAANVGIKFYTPEEFFLGESAAKFEWGSIDPVKFLMSVPTTKSKEQHHKKNQELLVLVGVPASGKSTFSKQYFQPNGYVSVNRDTLGTVQKCLKVAREALDSGKSVVVDNTNPSRSARGAFLELAKEFGVPCRCFWLQTSLALAHHLNLVRQNQTDGGVRRVPDVGYNMFKKNFEEPAMDEGFTEIKKVDFVPRFASTRDENIFKQWTTAGH
ncbi:hypothetical protein C0Q70_17111 [Pomacea canaliculata]|uniref:PNK FHA domain-containing protein n=1 Tax=Pomacea canaliculata TaxID=400727 RepID=A0A2T7NRP1_POMCA|nr:uncharacterized protein F21D5.5-like [Pomacea canaliculata]PVD23837.1 hypothetical protein C0Q70_17111 [Pomacea canaliculata]